MDYTFRPLTAWPRQFTRDRKRNPFGATFSKTMRQLENELGHLRARNIVIQLALNDADLRLDGGIRASARPSHPGIILTFEKPIGGGKYTTLNFPCDTYVDWQTNLRAVTLALDALRRVDRYGVTNFSEQYRGWAQLPPGEGERKPIVTPTMTVEEAARFVAQSVSPDYPPDLVMQSPDNYRSAYRKASLILHPDQNNGIERPAWHQLQAANDVLKAHHHL